jgi:hypothetical protein
MTKRQLIKWLEAKREEAIGEVCSQATDTLNTYYTDRNTKIELEETASEIANLMKQASDKVDAFKAKVKASYPDADISGGYYGSVTYKLNNLISKYEIRDGLLKEFEDKQTPLVKSIIARKNDLISGIKSNYANVIANVQNMKNAKLAMEYLTGLGFDLTSLIEEDKNPVTTALAVEVDTRFLFIGGKKDEME